MNFFNFLQTWEIPLHQIPFDELEHTHEPIESCEYLDQPLRTHEQPFLNVELGDI